MNDEVKYVGADDDRSVILANIQTLTGSPWLNGVYESVVPGAFEGLKNESIFDGPVDIFFEGNKLVLYTNETFNMPWMDNLQFTLAWDQHDEKAAKQIQNFNALMQVNAQGEAVLSNGAYYQSFAAIDLEIGQQWKEGEKITLMSFDDLAGSSIRIADDHYTSDNNAMYYVSLWGDNVTGMIKNPELGRTARGEFQVYPNPVTDDQINLVLPEHISGQIQVSILDMHGNLKSNQIKIADQGLLNLKIHDLTNGVYMISVNCDAGQYQSRFILTR